MKKKTLLLVALAMMFMVSGFAQNLNEYSSQEVLNSVINDGALGTRYYSVQEALNLVFDDSGNALKVTLSEIGLGTELLSDTEDFSGGWTLAGDFDLATTDFEYNDSANSGTMTQANADFSGTLVASTWYLLKYTLSDVTTAVDGTITASLGTSSITIELGVAETYYYLIESDATVTGDDFVMTVASSTQGDITGDLVSLKQVTSVDGVFQNLLVSNDLSVEGNVDVKGDIKVDGNLYIANNGWVYGRNNANSAWVQLFKINTSDNIEFGTEQESGNSYWGLNSGIVTTDYMNISSASANGVSHGFNWQVNGYNMLTMIRDSDGAGDSDTPYFKIPQGAITLKEITTPTALADWGQVYTKTDNHLYFQDGGGTEHLLTEGSSDYGEMGNVYGSSAPEVMNSADEWHGLCHANITGSAPHLNSGFSFVAGKLGSGNITTAQGGSSINIADVAHGLLTADFATVQSANHVGVGTVLYVDADNFEVDIAFVGNEASTWQMGSYLLIATAGIYSTTWSGSFSQSDNATRNSIMSPFVNTTQRTKSTVARALDNNTDVGSVSGNELMDCSVGDRIWFGAQSADPQTLTFTVRNMSIH